nr:MAG TPA: hypothetical protein [Caudoviricetes sp.]
MCTVFRVNYIEINLSRDRSTTEIKLMAHSQTVLTLFLKTLSYVI